mgnify:CR=1 FL=1
MPDEQIKIIPYDSSWPAKFEKEKKLIENTIGEFIHGGIHHIGSTSIPNLSAKPIIDILVGVESLEKSKPCIELLSKIHYQYSPYKPDIEHWFCKPSPEHRTHHLHLIAAGHPEFKARLAFRDYLRTHEDAKSNYEKLKLRLAEEFRNDREAYTQAKGQFVKAILTKALVE